MPPIVSIINVLVAIVTTLNFLVQQPFIPADWLPWIMFATVVLNGAVDLLRKLYPQNVLMRALRW